MESLLFLAHRMPYPPNKGDKIRSFHLLSHLSRRYRVYLGAFVDDPSDYRYENKLREMCHEVCLIKLNPRWRRLWSLRALFTGGALSVAYFSNRRLKRWVSDVLRRSDVRRMVVFSSPMAQYVMGNMSELRGRTVVKVMDFVDVDAEKWRTYGERRLGLAGWIYRREARRLLVFDRQVATDFDANVFVSQPEAALFRRLVPTVTKPIVAIENGVDTEFFNPNRDYPNPYGFGGDVVVFTGAMDYWANVDAVVWFVQTIFPLVRQQIPRARFFIVGIRPTDAVRRLTRYPGVYVTGEINDIRGYLHHAVAAVAPLRVARGIQNKVLEAMAMARPVVMTRAADQGVGVNGALATLIADDAQEFANHTIELLRNLNNRNLGRLGREFVERRYCWSDNMSKFSILLGGDVSEESSQEFQRTQAGELGMGNNIDAARQ